MNGFFEIDSKPFAYHSKGVKGNRVKGNNNTGDFLASPWF